MKCHKSAPSLKKKKRNRLANGENVYFIVYCYFVWRINERGERKRDTRWYTAHTEWIYKESLCILCKCCLSRRRHFLAVNINMNGIRNRNNHNNVVIIYTDNNTMMWGRNIEGSWNQKENIMKNMYIKNHYYDDFLYYYWWDYTHYMYKRKRCNNNNKRDQYIDHYVIWMWLMEKQCTRLFHTNIGLIFWYIMYLLCDNDGNHITYGLYGECKRDGKLLSHGIVYSIKNSIYSIPYSIDLFYIHIHTRIELPFRTFLIFVCEDEGYTYVCACLRRRLLSFYFCPKKMFIINDLYN